MGERNDKKKLGRVFSFQGILRIIHGALIPWYTGVFLFFPMRLTSVWWKINTIILPIIILVPYPVLLHICSRMKKQNLSDFDTAFFNEYSRKLWVLLILSLISDISYFIGWHYGNQEHLYWALLIYLIFLVFSFIHNIIIDFFSISVWSSIRGYILNKDVALSFDKEIKMIKMGFKIDLMRYLVLIFCVILVVAVAIFSYFGIFELCRGQIRDFLFM